MSEIKPTPARLNFLDMELGIFLHFGIRTFNEDSRDWDFIPMDPATFNPTELDCNKWCEQIVSAGAKYAILTTKHHDGFALWQTDTTEFSVKNSPFKGGKGDVVKEFTDAARKAGLKVGLYYSTSQFSAKSTEGNVYSDFVVQQVTEILSRYGKIDILWFDGCGSNGDTIDFEALGKLIHTLQPGIDCMYGGPMPFRWVGNEWGFAHMKNENVVDYVSLDLTHDKESLRKREFLPAECDCCMVRNDAENFWFYTEGYKDCLRTKEEIVAMYYYSIGRGANLLLNLAPDRRGLLQESNVELLQYMHDEVKRRFEECAVLPDRVEKTDKEYNLYYDRAYLFDQVVLEEDLTDGQNIHEFTVYIAPYHTPDRIAVYRGYTVGHRMICTFPPMRGRCLDIVFDNAEEGAKLTKILPLYVSGEQIVQKPRPQKEND